MAASQPAQPLQQPPLMSHPLDLEQHGENEGKDAYLFSNPTFESYLDPVSDEERELMSACTTPRSALKQQASQTAIHSAPPLAQNQLPHSCRATPSSRLACCYTPWQVPILPILGPAMPHWSRHTRCRHTL